MTPRLNYKKASPDTWNAVIGVSTQLNAASIDPKLRALIELRVSQINGCAYCVDLHIRELRKLGEKAQRIDCLTVWREVGFYDERERTALAWAEALTRVERTQAPDDVYEAMRAQFDERAAVDLTVVISQMNSMNRISIGFRGQPPARAD
ncbi:carboxymuconolactone decarboxylase family protein [Luteimonas aquatica]|uniref:carboxymuconolactone decarboxylase family protein n=1 Tax=Luteimonas aquatica TaxID=450364 RepID=UPI001F59AD48|nr:carboxymuconolactone decarboxylase family protein [Luteimonas aquatica]